MAPPDFFIYNLVNLSHNQIEVSVVHVTAPADSLVIDDAKLYAILATDQQKAFYLGTSVHGVMTTPYATTAEAIAAAKKNLVPSIYVSGAPSVPTTFYLTYAYATVGSLYYPALEIGSTPGAPADVWNLRIEVPHSSIK